MAWQFTGFEPGDNTGHVFFVAETPRLLDSGVFAVRVYDSAAEPHFEDTRGMERTNFQSESAPALSTSKWTPRARRRLSIRTVRQFSYLSHRHRPG